MSRSRKNSAHSLLGKMPPWLLIGVCVVVAAFFVLITAGEMGWLPFETPSWDELFQSAGIEDAYVPADLTGEETVAVHIIDVGQGDSIFIRTKGKSVLIDAGEKESGQSVCDYLSAAGVEKLDLVIGTHPHSDHIGGLATVLERFPTEQILLPDIPENLVPTTATFERLLDAVEQNGVQTALASPGQTYDLGDGVKLTILGPVKDYDSLNNVSVVCRLDSGETSFLFTGDAEKEVETDLLSQGANLQADVLKAGHHGSNTSSGKEFLDAVQPKIAAISCGADNKYGHPHKEVMERLSQREIAVYRTDLSGSIVFTTDGQNLSVKTAKEMD